MESFGRYQLLKKLAAGGMAEIWLARQQGLEGFEKLLVIKRILPHLAEDEEFIQMFLDEARIAARLNHPNIVQIFDLGAIGDSYFIAMEYVHGEDVRRVWKEAESQGTALSTAHTCRIVMDAASALDYAHKRSDPATGKPLGIIHRDVSPQNIIVSFDGGVKLVDFGIAKAADSSQHTRSGVLKGKYSYMSPEQAGGKKIDFRTDVFALGVVSYELLTGARLFKRGTEMETIKAVMECSVEPPSVVNPRIPPALDAVVMKALARNPDDRFQSASEFQLALEDWLVQNRLPSSSVHIQTFMRELYRERLAEEIRIGRPLWEDMHGLESSSEDIPVPALRTGITKETARSGKSDGRRAHLPPPPPPVPTPPPDDLELDNEPTEGAPSLATDSRQTESATEEPPQPRRTNLTAVAVSALVVAGIAVGVVAKWMLNAPATPTQFPPTLPPESPARSSLLEVRSEPPGARVFFDGVLEDDRTPATFRQVSRGAHSVLLQKPGFKDRELHFSVETDLKRIDEALEPAASPPKPISERQPPPRAAANEEKPDSKAAKPPPSGAGERTGLVEITSEPRATVLLGGKEKGTTPFRERLPPGKYAFVLVNHDVGLEHALNVTVRAGHDLRENVAPQIVPVRFVAEPWADVYLGAKKLGQTPMGKVPLAEGEHTFIFKNDELQVTKTVKYLVKPGGAAVVKVNMTE